MSKQPDPATMSGKDLDAAVHVDVMGGELIVVGNGDPQAYGGGDQWTIPPYSTSIEAAWSVVEKMRADDWLVVVKCNTDAARFIIEGSRSEYDAPCPDRPIGPKGSFACELKCMRAVRDPKAKWRRDEWALAESAPRAICLAALAAVREEQ